MMNTYTGEKKWALRLGPYITYLLRWGWFIVLAIAVTIIVTLLLPDATQPAAYQATLQVQVILPANLATATGVTNTTTFYASLATSPSTFSILLPKYRGFQASDLQGLVTATPISGTNYFDITVTWDTAKDVTRLANNVYEAVLQEVQMHRSSLNSALIANLTAEFKREQNDAASSEATMQQLTLEHRQFSFEYLQVNGLYNKQILILSNVNKQLQALEQSGVNGNARLRLGSTTPIITTIPPPNPTQSQRLEIAPLIGLIMGLGGILLASKFTKRVPLHGKRREIVLPHIAAMIPVLAGLQTNRLEVIQKMAPCLPLYQHLRFRASEHERRLQIITVTSAQGREGKSLIATGLAIAASHSGQGTLLIDANPQRPILHTWFHTPNQVGTIDAVDMLTKRDMVLPITVTAEPNLAMIPIGTEKGMNGLTEALPVGGLDLLIQAVRQQADVIIFDVSSLLDDANAVNLAQLSDMVLLVVDEQRSQNSAVIEAKSLLSTISIPFAIVLNRSQTEEVE
jgi:Mrp family chromosome partitioning ATPase